MTEDQKMRLCAVRDCTHGWRHTGVCSVNIGGVVIWSGEHRAWWRPDGHGYTGDIRYAGLYTLQDARDRTMHCGPEKEICIESWDQCLPEPWPGGTVGAHMAGREESDG